MTSRLFTAAVLVSLLTLSAAALSGVNIISRAGERFGLGTMNPEACVHVAVGPELNLTEDVEITLATCESKPTVLITFPDGRKISVFLHEQLDKPRSQPDGAAGGALAAGGACAEQVKRVVAGNAIFSRYVQEPGATRDAALTHITRIQEYMEEAINACAGTKFERALQDELLRIDDVEDELLALEIERLEDTVRFGLDTRTIPPARSWAGKQDNRSEEALMYMSEFRLAGEARSVCLYNTDLIRRGKELPNDDWKEYLTAIEDAARNRNQGTTPQWIEEMELATFGDDPMRCDAIAARVYPWMGKQDSQSEKRLMQTPEFMLAEYARGVCLYKTDPARRGKGLPDNDWEEYLTAIESALRERHQGTTPQWIEDMKRAAVGDSPRKCRRIAASAGAEPTE